MIIDIEKINLRSNGVIQIGAHHGQEHKAHKKIGCSKFLYFEPQKDVYEILKENISKEKEENDFIKLYNYALGSNCCAMEMYKEKDNTGQSSSLLEPELHLKQYPGIKFTEKETVIVKTLDLVIEEEKLDPTDYDFLNIDVQGYELEVLKGATKQLEHVYNIMLEVNRAPVYKNCAMVEEIDDFLKEYGFQRVITNWAGGIWGDAIYTNRRK
jgi:FkbM family methyltransferase